MKLFLTILMTFLAVREYGYSQGGVLKEMIKEDTLFISYLANFNYDVIVLYVNGVKVDEKILYSMSTTSNTSNGKNIVYNSDSLKLTIYYYRRNHDLSLEYNALWWQWSLIKDNAWYFPPIISSLTIYPTKTGKYIGISIKADESSGRFIDYKLEFDFSKSPFILE